MLMPTARRQILLLLTISAIAGCAGPALHQGKSPLMPAQMSSDAVVLEMFFVRCPFGDPTVNEKLWQEIDEQQFPAELRERWRGTASAWEWSRAGCPPSCRNCSS